MQKLIFIFFLGINLSFFGQAKKDKIWLDDFAVCECIFQSYKTFNIKMDFDSSLGYWYIESPLNYDQNKIFAEYISGYVSKRNVGYENKHYIINYCLGIKSNKEYIYFRNHLLKSAKKHK